VTSGHALAGRALLNFFNFKTDIQILTRINGRIGMFVRRIILRQAPLSPVVVPSYDWFWCLGGLKVGGVSG
jgi:hypothetical protein